MFCGLHEQRVMWSKMRGARGVRGAWGKKTGKCNACECAHRVLPWVVAVQPKRAGYRNGSGMDMWEWQLEKRDEQLLSCDGDWTKFHEKPAADHH